MGNTLIATQIIKNKQLVCEYLGELSILGQSVDINNEYVELEKNGRGETIVIDSTYVANEARFIAGSMSD